MTTHFCKKKSALIFLKILVANVKTSRIGNQLPGIYAPLLQIILRHRAGTYKQIFPKQL
jgi:hypothetical protein